MSGVRVGITETGAEEERQRDNISHDICCDLSKVGRSRVNKDAKL